MKNCSGTSDVLTADLILESMHPDDGICVIFPR
jgi:hypothetical protein